jgi:hypothetical protein
VAAPWLFTKSVASFIWAARLAATAGGARGAYGRALHVAEDGVRAGCLRLAKISRVDRAHRTREGRRIDVVVVLVQAVDGGGQDAIARVRFALGVVQLVAAAPQAATDCGGGAEG